MPKCSHFFIFVVCTEKPVNADQQERTLLKGVFSVRKGKTQLHKWAERQVILCGTSLIVASVKDSLTGKMHILPLVGGKVRVHRHPLTHCRRTDNTEQMQQHSCEWTGIGRKTKKSNMIKECCFSWPSMYIEHNVTVNLLKILIVSFDILQ